MLPNGNITFIANGMNNLSQPLHSRAVEFDTKKREVVWQFKDPRQWTFFTPIMGSVQRLENSNTVICEALNGRVFEVNTNDEIVWDYVAPCIIIMKYLTQIVTLCSELTGTLLVLQKFVAACKTLKNISISL